MAGTYNFSDASLYIPEVSTLPAVDVPDGAIYHVKSSGVLAVHSGLGGKYAIFSLDSLPYTGPLLPLAPDEIADLAFWFKAESGQLFQNSISEDTPITSGNQVFLWKDSGPHGNDANAFGSMEPNWLPNQLGDGINSVQFGGGQLCNVSGMSDIVDLEDEEVTLFALLKFINDSSNQNVYGAGNTGSNTQSWTFRGRIDGGGGSDKVLGSRKSDNGGGAASVEGAAGTFNASTLQLINWRTASGTGQFMSMWQNGSGIVTRESFDVGSCDFNRFSFGGNKRVSAEPSLNADVVELFAFSGSISADDRLAVQQYIEDTYGVVMSGSV
jgi:hypothetical protein